MGGYIQEARENHVKKKVEEGTITILNPNPKPIFSLSKSFNFYEQKWVYFKWVFFIYINPQMGFKL